jgi:hypothetical protein
VSVRIRGRRRGRGAAALGVGTGGLERRGDLVGGERVSQSWPTISVTQPYAGVYAAFSARACCTIARSKRSSSASTGLPSSSVSFTAAAVVLSSSANALSG